MRLFKCLTRERGISEGQKGNSNSLCGPLIECGPLTVGAKKKRIKREIEVSTITREKRNSMAQQLPKTEAEISTPMPESAVKVEH